MNKIFTSQNPFSLVLFSFFLFFFSFYDQPTLSQAKKITRALRALVGVVLSLDPEGKEKGSWWHSTSDFVLIARDAVVLLIVALGALLCSCQHPFGSEDDKGLENTGCEQSAGGFAAFGR